MRTTRAIPIGLALVLAPGRASAETPRVSLRLDYTRGPGGEACPAEPAALRGEVEKRMGYDPFDRPDAARERLAVVLVRKGGGYAATVERFNAAGVSMWAETFPKDPLQSGCAALISPLASYLRSMFLGYQAAPAAPPPEPAAPPSEHAAPAPPELRASPAQPANPPEPPNVPNPARNTAKIVAIVSSVATGAFLVLSVVWTVDARGKRNTAELLSAQLHQDGGDYACARMGSGTPKACAGLVSAFQSASTSIESRNAWYVATGVSAATGITSTVLAFTLPSTMRGQPIPRLSVRPTSLLIQGSF